LSPNRLSTVLAGLRARGTPVLDLTESNPTRVALAHPPREVLEALCNPAALTYEPHPAGQRAAREAVAGYYASRGLDVDPGDILLTAGTSDAYSYLFKLLADPGDEVLVPRPSYPLFEFLGRLDSVTLTSYPLVYDGGWRVDLDGLRAAITSRTRAVLLVNPNNPTGSFLKREELSGILRTCERHNLSLISDEVFADYAFRPDPSRIECLANVRNVLVFCLGGVSKMLGLPQMKLSWVAIGGPAALRRQAMERLEWIADTYLAVSTPTQLALPTWLALRRPYQDQLMGRLSRNLEYLKDQTCRSACQLLEVEGGWYAILRLPRTRSEEDWVLHFLKKNRVLVQPGYFYDFPDEAFIVVSLLSAPDVFREGVRRIVASAGM